MANDSKEKRAALDRIRALPLETRQRLRQKVRAKWDKEAASKSGDAAGESKPDEGEFPHFVALNYLALAAVVGWAIYSLTIALALVLMSGFIAIFYAGALTGNADQKVVRTFSILVIAISFLMLCTTGDRRDGSPDAPRMCGRVEC